MAKRLMTEEEKQANRERVARWREKHIEGNGEKERLQMVLEAGTKARLQTIAAHRGHTSITALIEAWARDEADAIEKPARKTRKK